MGADAGRGVNPVVHRLLGALLALCAGPAFGLHVSVHTAQGIEHWRLPANAPAQRLAAAEVEHAPLGSLWKLLVQAYLLDRGLRTADYRCRGGDPEEVYCCAAGASIDAEEALLRSCGRYFEPARLALDAADWGDYWRALGAPSALTRLDALQPQTQVEVAALLELLQRLPARAELQRVLAAASLQQPAPVFEALGAGLRIKTWSWHRGEDLQDRIGGFAGWDSQGRALWAQGEGTSRGLLLAHAAALARWLPAPASLDAGGCVEVELFARYPIEAIEPAATPGALHGRYRLQFAHGSRFEIESRGEILLDAGPRLIARIPREDYVARVVEREGALQPAAAARALAVLARSYLQQQAQPGPSCLRIEDSSHTQRVLAQPPSMEARRIAAFSEGLVLAGMPVRYHLDQSGPGLFGWQPAVAAARSGAGSLDLLREAFPQADLARWEAAASACEALPAARDWLLAQLPRWRRQLLTEPGYAERRDFEVCRLKGGQPHVDRARARIHVRGNRSLQDRLDLAHEYLHLGFAAHPHGEDEAFIEAWARRLVLGAAE